MEVKPSVGGIKGIKNISRWKRFGGKAKKFFRNVLSDVSFFASDLIDKAIVQLDIASFTLLIEGILYKTHTFAMISDFAYHHNLPFLFRRVSFYYLAYGLTSGIGAMYVLDLIKDINTKIYKVAGYIATTLLLTFSLSGYFTVGAGIMTQAWKRNREPVSFKVLIYNVHGGRHEGSLYRGDDNKGEFPNMKVLLQRFLKESRGNTITLTPCYPYSKIKSIINLLQKDKDIAFQLMNLARINGGKYSFRIGFLDTYKIAKALGWDTKPTTEFFYIGNRRLFRLDYETYEGLVPFSPFIPGFSKWVNVNVKITKGKYVWIRIGFDPPIKMKDYDTGQEVELWWIDVMWKISVPPKLEGVYPFIHPLEKANNPWNM